MTLLKIHLFGYPRFQRNDENLNFRRRKVQALFAYLVVKGGPVSRESLATMFWPEFGQSQSLANLRREMARLKQIVGPLVLADRAQLQIDPGAEVLLDIEQYKHLIDENSTKSLKEAIDLYQADFMTGFLLADSPEFDDWQFFEREGLKESLAQASQKILKWHKAKNEFERAIPYARRWLEFDNLNEAVHRELMQLYAQSGQRGTAIHQYQECVELFKKELRVGLEAETTDLYEKIRSGKAFANSFGPHTPPLPAPVSTHNLPAETGRIIGRTKDKHELSQKLISGDTRLVTITGPGGIGKSRLALAVAHQLAAPNTDSPISNRHFSDGIFFVSLTNLKSRDEIILSLIDSLGLTTTGAPPDKILFKFIANKKILFLFDNFDRQLNHVNVVVEILQYGAQTSLLMTSRARLRLSHEHIFILRGLSTDNDNPLDSDAAKLLLAQATRINPNLTLTASDTDAVRRVCQSLRGNPLALVLAAGWSDMLSLTEIAQEIDSSLDFLSSKISDVPERQKSMRVVFDQSWQMINIEEQEVFSKLAIFQNGFTRDAAQKIANATLPQLSSLIGKSLVYLGRDGRYEIHELLRQYAFEKLDLLNDSTVKIWDRYSKFFGAYSDSLAINLKGALQNEALQKINADFRNIKAGSGWLLTHLTKDRTLIFTIDQYVEPLFHFFDIKGRFQEGASHFQLMANAILQLKEAGRLSSAESVILGKVVGRQGWFTFHIGQHSEAKALMNQSLTLLEREKAQSEAAFTHNYLGAMLRHFGEHINARNHLTLGLQSCRELKDQFGITVALNILGQIAYLEGDYRDARLLCAESLAIKKRIGDQRGMIYSLSYSGRAAMGQDDLVEAERLFKESLKLSEAIGDPRSVAISKSNLADVKILQQKLSEAQLLLEQSLGSFEEILDQIGLVTVQTRLGDIAILGKDLNHAWHMYEKALLIARTLQPSPVVLDLLVSVAELQSQLQANDQSSQIIKTLVRHPKIGHLARARSKILQSKLIKQSSLSSDFTDERYEQSMPINVLIDNILSTGQIIL